MHPKPRPSSNISKPTPDEPSQNDTFSLPRRSAAKTGPLLQLPLFPFHPVFCHFSPPKNRRRLPIRIEIIPHAEILKPFQYQQKASTFPFGQAPEPREVFSPAPTRLDCAHEKPNRSGQSSSQPKKCSSEHFFYELPPGTRITTPALPPLSRVISGQNATVQNLPAVNPDMHTPDQEKPCKIKDFRHSRPRNPRLDICILR